MEYTTRVCGEESVSYGGNQDRSLNSVRNRSLLYSNGNTVSDLEVFLCLFNAVPL